MANANKPELDAVADSLLHAFFQFRNLYRNESFHHMGSGMFKDLRHSEIMLLFVLEKAERGSPEGVNVSDLSRCMQVKPPSITPLLTRLEKRSLIERSMDKADRRIVRVKLCEVGRGMVLRHKKMVLESIEGLVGYLGAERSVLFTRLINDTYTYVSQNMNPHSGGKERPE